MYPELRENLLNDFTLRKTIFMFPLRKLLRKQCGRSGLSRGHSRLVCLCSIISEASAEKLVGWGGTGAPDPESPEGCSLPFLVANPDSPLGPLLWPEPCMSLSLHVVLASSQHGSRVLNTSAPQAAQEKTHGHSGLSLGAMSLSCTLPTETVTNPPSLEDREHTPGGVLHLLTRKWQVPGS